MDGGHSHRSFSSHTQRPRRDHAGLWIRIVVIAVIVGALSYAYPMIADNFDAPPPVPVSNVASLPPQRLPYPADRAPATAMPDAATPDDVASSTAQGDTSAPEASQTP